MAGPEDRDRGRRPPGPPGDAGDEDLRELVGRLMRRLALVVDEQKRASASQDRLQAVVEEEVAGVAELRQALTPIALRVGKIEKAVEPFAEELEKMRDARKQLEADRLEHMAELGEQKKMRIAYEGDQAATKKLVNRFGWIGSLLVAAALGGAITTVKLTWDNAHDVADLQESLKEAKEATRVRTRDVDERFEALRESVSGMSAVVQSDRAREDERWDRVKEALERLERRRR